MPQWRSYPFRVRPRSERGQTVIEFALGAALFLMTIFGLIEFARAVWHYNMVANLAQEGARWASVRGLNSSFPATSSDVETFIQGRAVNVVVTASASPDPSSLGSGAAVTVTVQSTFNPVVGNLIPISAITLSSSAQMIMAR